MKIKVYITDYVTVPKIEKKIFGDAFDIVCLNEENEKKFPKSIEDADAILVWHAKLTKYTFKKLRKCKIIVKYGTGYDNVNVNDCSLYNIPFCNTPDYGVEEVADSTCALILNSIRQIKLYDNLSKKSNLKWQRHSDFEIKRTNEHKLGIIGCGRIGTSVSIKMKSFGINVAFYDPHKPSGYEKSIGTKRFDSLKELFSLSSIISLHTPLNSETNGLINKRNIIKFNKRTIFINTARGKLVDSLDTLLFGLEQNYLSFIGLDVLPDEPPGKNEKLIKLWINQSVYSDRIIINPHSAYYSKASWIEMREKASLNIKDFLIDSKIKNRIN